VLCQKSFDVLINTLKKYFLIYTARLKYYYKIKTLLYCRLIKVTIICKNHFEKHQLLQYTLTIYIYIYVHCIQPNMCLILIYTVSNLDAKTCVITIQNLCDRTVKSKIECIF